ncbi:hypothetical protein BST61_g7727 [Cercospora zeina]
MSGRCMILNSMANIHNTVDNPDQALEFALADFKGGTDFEIYKDFSNFGHIQALELGLDIFGVVIGAVFASPFARLVTFPEMDRVILDSFPNRNIPYMAS